MPKTDLKIYTTNNVSGSKITTSVPYVNDAANSDTLKTFAQQLNAFTTNNYERTDRVQTITVDTEQVPVPATPKTEPTLTVSNWTLIPSGNNGIYADVTYNGDGILTSSAKYTEGTYLSIETSMESPNRIYIRQSGITLSTQLTICITASETETYASKTITITRP